MFETPRPRGAEPRLGGSSARLEDRPASLDTRGGERPAITGDGVAGDLSAAARPAPLKEDYRHA